MHTVSNWKRVSRVLAGAVVILILAQTLNAVLSISSFEQTYRESLISNYRILTRELQSQVERDVSFGRPVYLLGGIERIFETIRQQETGIAALYVTFPDRRVIYSTNPNAVGMQLGSAEFPQFSTAPTAEDLLASTVTQYRDSYFVSAPVYYDAAELVGVVHLEFSRSLIVEAIRSVIRDNARYFVPILLSSVLLIAALLVLIDRSSPATLAATALTRRNTAAIVIVLLLGQLSYAWFNNHYFDESYIEIFDSNVDSLARTIVADIDVVLDYGVPLERLRGAEHILEASRIASRESNRILITDLNGQILYAATPEGVGGLLGDTTLIAGQPRIPTVQTPVLRLTPLTAGDERVGYLAVNVNTALITQQLRNLLLDVLTVIVVSVIFSLELVRLLTVFVREEKVGGESTADTTTFQLNVIRLTSFIFFFAALIPLSFLPAYIEQTFQASPVTFLGLSTETIVSLPIASYMLGVAIFIPVVGFLSNRISVRRIFFITGGLFIAGTLVTAFASSIITLVFARLLAGLGYGGVITNSTNLVIAATTEDNRSTGFGIWSAGFAAATICAIAIGGVIVNRLGFTVGMLTATFSAVLLLLFVSVSVKAQPGAADQRTESDRISAAEFFALFRNRTLVVNLLFSSVPFSLAYIGLFQYVFPLYMGSQSISQANIGRILTVYGLISLATPLISRIADRAKNEKLLIIVGNSITGLSLLIFYLADRAYADINPVFLLIPVILGMGFGGMMIDAVEESFITSSREAREMGETKLLSLYTTYDKVISIIVPVVAGTLITAIGYSASIGAIGAFTVLGVVLFGIFSQNLRRLVQA